MSYLDDPDQSGALADDVPPTVDFAAAQSAVDKLIEEYPAHAKHNLNEIKNRFSKFCGNDPEEEMLELRRFAHNFTGQGASFNYPLISEIAESLRVYLNACGVFSALKRGVVETHFDAMQEVLDRGLSGDSGDAGFAIRARVDGAVGQT